MLARIFVYRQSLRQFFKPAEFFKAAALRRALRDRGLSYLLNLYAGIKALLGPETTMGLPFF